MFSFQKMVYFLLGFTRLVAKLSALPYGSQNHRIKPQFGQPTATDPSTVKAPKLSLLKNGNFILTDAAKIEVWNTKNTLASPCEIAAPLHWQSCSICLGKDDDLAEH